MKKTTVRWTDGLRFVGTDSNGQTCVLSGDDQPSGVRPSELFLIALSACSAVDVAGILAKKRIRLESLEVIAEGDQDSEPPWTYRSIRLKFRISGSGLTVQAAEQAVRLSEEKYCSVAATVRATANISTAVEILPAEKNRPNGPPR